MYRNRMYLQTPRPSASLVDQLGSYSVAALQAASRGEYLVSAGMNTLGLPGPERRIAGPAVTSNNAAADNLAMHAATSLTEPGDVLVVTSDDGDSAALWGELMTELAKARGLRGVIVDGAIRDVAGIRDLGFPVWYRSINPRTATKAGIGGVNTPVFLLGGVVHPGDIVVADEDGIMAIPAAEAEHILEKAAGVGDEEDALRVRLREGETYFSIADLNHPLEQAGVEIVDGPCERARPTGGQGDA